MKNLHDIIRKLRGSVTIRMDQEEKGISEPEEEIEVLDYSSKELKKKNKRMHAKPVMNHERKKYINYRYR